MAFVVVSSDTFVTQTLNHGDMLLVTEGTTLGVNSDGVDGQGSLDMTVLGNIVSGVGEGIGIDDGSFVRLNVGQAGTIIAQGAGGGVDIDASNLVSLINDGTISATYGYGVEVGGVIGDTDVSIHMTNTGLISVTNGTYAVRLNSGDSATEFLNTGAITSLRNGAYLTATNGEIHATNSGLIQSEDVALRTAGTFGNIINSGRIQAQETAIDLGNGGVLINDGDIVSLDASAIYGNAATKIINTGTVIGNISLSTQDDEVINSGYIQGNIYLAGGDDTYVGRKGVVDGAVFGSTGNDTFIGGSDVDLFNGSTGADDLRGRRGDDELLGEVGDDYLSGGKDEDLLNGGPGQDQLRGGRGEDTFVFTTTDDSLIGAVDKILDFKRRADVIDLSEIGDLGFIGKNGFSGNGSGEVRAVKKPGKVKVLVDADGDGTADMEIDVLDLTKLTGADFIL